jgi:two-component system, OmpR family, response regulator
MLDAGAPRHAPEQQCGLSVLLQQRSGEFSKGRMNVMRRYRCGDPIEVRRHLYTDFDDLGRGLFLSYSPVFKLHRGQFLTKMSSSPCAHNDYNACPVGLRTNRMESLSHHRILVIEDDLETAGQIADSLTTQRYDVDVARNGADAIKSGLATSYALITIDRMLPDMDGLSVMQHLRTHGVNTPVLIISALGEIDERVRGLRAGGDDYLVKPFSFVEMVARVEALCRRSSTIIKETRLTVGDLEMDLVSRTVTRRGQSITLLPREFRLLEYLIRSQGQTVSRTMLLQQVWDLHYDPTTNIIDVYVARLRRKLDDSQSYPLIHTVRGVGYRLYAPN